MRQGLMAGVVMGLAVLAGGGGAHAEGDKLDMLPGAGEEMQRVAADYETLLLAVACRLRDAQWHRETWPLLRARAQEAIEKAVHVGVDRQFAEGFMNGARVTSFNMTVARISRDRTEACHDLQRIRSEAEWLDGLLR